MGGSVRVQRPSAAALVTDAGVLDADGCNDTVTVSPAGASPHTVTGLPRCRTAWSWNKGLSWKVCGFGCGCIGPTAIAAPTVETPPAGEAPLTVEAPPAVATPLSANAMVDKTLCR